MLRPLFSRRSSRAVHRQVSWLTDHPTPRVFPLKSMSSDAHGFRPRSQWRNRDGISPSSLFNVDSRETVGRKTPRYRRHLRTLYSIVINLPKLSRSYITLVRQNVKFLIIPELCSRGCLRYAATSAHCTVKTAQLLRRHRQNIEKTQRPGQEYGADRSPPAPAPG